MRYSTMSFLFMTTNEVLEKISEEYMEKEFRDYWAKINKQKLSSSSGRYVELCRAMAIAAKDPMIKDQ